MQGTWVQSLVRGLRSHMLWSNFVLQLLSLHALEPTHRNWRRPSRCDRDLTKTKQKKKKTRKKANIRGPRDPSRRGWRSCWIRKCKIESQMNRDIGPKCVSLMSGIKTAGAFCGQSTALISMSDFLRLLWEQVVGKTAVWSGGPTLVSKLYGQNWVNIVPT